MPRNVESRPVIGAEVEVSQTILDEVVGEGAIKAGDSMHVFIGQLNNVLDRCVNRLDISD